MKHLKIENNKGFYQLDNDEWKELDQLNKDDLMVLVDKAITADADFTMDEFDVEKVSNKAHEIIYRNLYQKLSELLENRSRFKDESEQIYKLAYEKYSKNLSEVLSSES